MTSEALEESADQRTPVAVDQRLEKILASLLGSSFDVEAAWKLLIDNQQEAQSGASPLPLELLFLVAAQVHHLCRQSWVPDFAAAGAGPLPLPLIRKTVELSDGRTITPTVGMYARKTELGGTAPRGVRPRSMTPRLETRHHPGELVLLNLRRLVQRANKATLSGAADNSRADSHAAETDAPEERKRPVRSPWTAYEQLVLRIYASSLCRKKTQSREGVGASIAKLAEQATRVFPQTIIGAWAYGRSARLYAQSFQEQTRQRAADPQALAHAAACFADCLMRALTAGRRPHTLEGLGQAARVPGLIFSLAWIVYEHRTHGRRSSLLVRAIASRLRSDKCMDALLDAYTELDDQRLLDRIGVCSLLAMACTPSRAAGAVAQPNATNAAFAGECMKLAVRYFAEREPHWAQVKLVLTHTLRVTAAESSPVPPPVISWLIHKVERLRGMLDRQSLLSLDSTAGDQLAVFIRNLVRCTPDAASVLDSAPTSQGGGLEKGLAQAFHSARTPNSARNFNPDASADQPADQQVLALLMQADELQAACLTRQALKVCERATFDLAKLPLQKTPAISLVHFWTHYQHGRALRQLGEFGKALTVFRKAARAGAYSYLLPHVAHALLAIHGIQQRADADREVTHTESMLRMFTCLGIVAGDGVLSIPYAANQSAPDLAVHSAVFLQNRTGKSAGDGLSTYRKIRVLSERLQEQREFAKGQHLASQRQQSRKRKQPDDTQRARRDRRWRAGLSWVLILDSEPSLGANMLAAEKAISVLISTTALRIQPLLRLRADLHAALAQGQQSSVDAPDAAGPIHLARAGALESEPDVTASWPHGREQQHALLETWRTVLDGRSLPLRAWTDCLLSLINICVQSYGRIADRVPDTIKKIVGSLLDLLNEKGRQLRREWWRDTDLADRTIELWARAAELLGDPDMEFEVRIEQLERRLRALPSLRQAGLGRRPSRLLEKDLASALALLWNFGQAAQLTAEQIENVRWRLSRVKPGDLDPEAITNLRPPGAASELDPTEEQFIYEEAASSVALGRPPEGDERPQRVFGRDDLARHNQGGELLLDYFLAPGADRGPEWDALCLVSRVLRLPNGTIRFLPVQLFDLGDGYGQNSLKNQRKLSQTIQDFVKLLRKRAEWQDDALQGLEAGVLPSDFKGLISLIKRLGRTLLPRELLALLDRLAPEHVYLCPHGALCHLPIHALPISFDDDCLLLKAFTVSYVHNPRTLARAAVTPPQVPPSALVDTELFDNFAAALKGEGCLPMTLMGSDQILEQTALLAGVAFACHGAFDNRSGSVWRSRLLLPEGIRLTVATIANSRKDLIGKEVLLLACNSAASRAEETDNTGLLNAFLQKGCTFVLGALFPIDAPKAAAFAQTYIADRRASSTPAQAFQNAVQKQRQNRNQDLGHFGNAGSAGSMVPRQAALTVEDTRRWLSWLDWAPYVFYGPKTPTINSP